MFNMVKKKDGVLVYGGFCLPETTKEQIRDKDKRVMKGKTFELVDELGNLYLVEDIRSFCKEFSLEEGSFRKILNEHMLYYKGFRLKRRQFEKLTNEKHYSFISPNGIIYSGFNVSKFAREHNLSISKMNAVRSGVRKSSAGWKNNPNFIPPNENNTQSSPDNPACLPAPSPTQDS